MLGGVNQACQSLPTQIRDFVARAVSVLDHGCFLIVFPLSGDGAVAESSRSWITVQVGRTAVLGALMSGPGGRDPEQESGVRDLRVAQRDPVVADGTGHASAAPAGAANDPVSGNGTTASNMAAPSDALADRSTVGAGSATDGAVDDRATDDPAADRSGASSYSAGDAAQTGRSAHAETGADVANGPSAGGSSPADPALASLCALLALHNIAADPAQLRHELGHDDPLSAGDLIRLAKRFAGVRAREKAVDWTGLMTTLVRS